MQGKSEEKGRIMVFIRHHGIKGQKWGVRNGPPYPLNSDKLASVIFRNAKKMSRS